MKPRPLRIHPKTGGASLGTAAGLVVVAILHSIPGVHLAPELPAAITGFLATLGAYLAPPATSPAYPPWGSNG